MRRLTVKTLDPFVNSCVSGIEKCILANEKFFVQTFWCVKTYLLFKLSNQRFHVTFVGELVASTAFTSSLNSDEIEIKLNALFRGHKLNQLIRCWNRANISEAYLIRTETLVAEPVAGKTFGLQVSEELEILKVSLMNSSLNNMRHEENGAEKPPQPVQCQSLCNSKRTDSQTKSKFLLHNSHPKLFHRRHLTEHVRHNKYFISF